MDDDQSAATRDFVRHRNLLFSITYDILGSVSDTEDVLQETWLAWAKRCGGGSVVDNPRAYLVRIAVNQALAHRSAIERRQETYLGPWLPEPLVASPAETQETLESVSFAMMVVLETLTPLERTVFVLGEVFGYPHTEIAGIVDRTPAAVRQLAHRAREHVQARRPRFPADSRLREQVTERFLAALLGGDLNAFLELLAPEVTVWTDGGGKARMAGLRGVHARDAVARMLAAGSFRPRPGIDAAYRNVNGDLAVVLLSQSSPFAVLVLDIAPDGAVTGVYAVTNPDKLTHIH
ncbi:MAG TPA: sigma-70 family RNA polymerase sigma factor [Micromonosporaceae bacterium]|jgi:RNA polymerase sigma-70 factor (ECF subfamily)